MATITLEEMLNIDKRVITIEELYSILACYNDEITENNFCGYEEDDYVAYPDLIQYLESKAGEDGFIIIDNEEEKVYLAKRK